ncbi:hypothetical protein BWI93_07150 [Siphonobacter sp. BAB-5385]|uniref:hypothetical protein n=1 Tax=Siphonobacter sp. BAB-5385 TaxID=1864822 RepID=UPI000B9DFBC8|nr:hypothetical protein [Siphonobacter sp. BAB-5385]OZI08804.1 hypothetical protein BWI93_07150 [Siphonobacter sp. BAB-5385]
MEFKAVLREEDDELMGFVRAHSETGPFEAYTLFKYSLHVFDTERQAENFLQTNGLRVLMERWCFFDEMHQDWYTCQITESNTQQIKYTITDFGHPDLYTTHVLSAPHPGNFKLKE